MRGGDCVPGARNGPEDAGLDLIRDRWPDLPGDVRGAVLRLVGGDVPEDTVQGVLALLDGSG